MDKETEREEENNQDIFFRFSFLLLLEFIGLQYDHGLMFNMKSLQTALASACPILKKPENANVKW